MRVRQAQRTKEGFKVAEKIAVELIAVVHEKDDNLLGHIFRVEAACRIEAPFCSSPNAIRNLQKSIAMTQCMPIKKIIKKTLDLCRKGGCQGNSFEVHKIHP